MLPMSSAAWHQSKLPRSTPWPSGSPTPWRYAGSARRLTVGGGIDLKTYGEGPVLLWYQEYYRFDVVLVVRVQHLGATTGPSAGDG